MPEVQTKTKQEDTCLLGYIDLLVQSALVKREDVAHLRGKYSTCEDLYTALESLGVIDIKKLTEYYAKAKGVPFVDIKSIDQQAYKLIDPELAKTFSFIPFAINEKDKIIQIAISDPVKLSRVSHASLKIIEKKLGYKIEIFLAPKSVVNELPLLMSEGGEFPKVDLSSYWIDESILRKIPYDLASKYKIIIFKQVSSREYNVAVADTTDKSILLMLEQMEKKAGIKFNIFSAQGSQLDKILRDYKNRNDQRKKQLEDELREKERVEREIEREHQKVLKEKENQERKAALERQAEQKRRELDEDRLSLAKPEKTTEKDAERLTEEESRKSSDEKDEPQDGEEKGKSILDFKVKTPGPDNDEGAGESSVSDEKSEGEKQVDKLEDPDLTKIIGDQKPSVELINGFATKGNIPQLLATIIAVAIEQEASDIHIEPFEKNVRLRYRVDGQLADIAQFPPQIQPQLVARVKILSKLKLDEQRVPQDGRFDAKSGKELVDIRVSSLPTVFGEKVVMRLLSKTKKLDDLADLGIEGINFDRIIEAISKPYGVVLATGPTGSGKSTTLYSVFSRLNKPEVNIITLEDPVEYEIPGINQVQVKPQIGFSFAEGLRSVLRQDPNIIMVGEIRDGETAELAVQAALTGHLVFSTLHTNDSPSALPRMYNLGVEPFLLTSAINAVIGQRLVRRICGKCRQEVTLPQSVIFQVKKELDPLNLNLPIKFYKGKGCSECKEGFKGRLGIYEVLKMSKAIEDLVLDKKSAGEIFTQACKEGMITMKQDGLIKAIKGATTVDEVFRVTRVQNKEG